jgi:hypothetical protein
MKSVYRFIVFVAVWVTLGAVGQYALGITHFGWIMGWGFFTGMVACIVEDIACPRPKKVTVIKIEKKED